MPIDITTNTGRVSVHRIANVAVVECVKQKTDFRGIINLLSAYDVALYASDNPPQEVHIMRLAQLIEPTYNNGLNYRRTPVTFANGGDSCNPQSIPSAMESLLAMIDIWDEMKDGVFPVDEVVKQFLWIHPFRDGNGRLAWILYNWLKGTLDYPLPLPNYKF